MRINIHFSVRVDGGVQKFVSHLDQEQLSVVIRPLEQSVKCLDEEMGGAHPEKFSETTNRESLKGLQKELTVPGTPGLESLVLGPWSERHLESSLNEVLKASLALEVCCLVTIEEALASEGTNLFEDFHPFLKRGVVLERSIVRLCDAPELNVLYPAARLESPTIRFSC